MKRKLQGTEGQDRANYTDTQDRENYTMEPNTMPHAHTPVDSWKILERKEEARVDSTTIECRVISNEDAIWVALVNDTETDDGLKHARLIAAAPEMLEALLAITPMFANDSPLLTVYRKEIKQVLNAITRATGREKGKT